MSVEKAYHLPVVGNGALDLLVTDFTSLEDFDRTLYERMRARNAGLQDFLNRIFKRAGLVAEPQRLASQTGMIVTHSLIENQAHWLASRAAMELPGLHQRGADPSPALAEAIRGHAEAMIPQVSPDTLEQAGARIEQRGARQFADEVVGEVETRNGLIWHPGVYAFAVGDRFGSGPDDARLSMALTHHLMSVQATADAGAAGAPR